MRKMNERQNDTNWSDVRIGKQVLNALNLNWSCIREILRLSSDRNLLVKLLVCPVSTLPCLSVKGGALVLHSGILTSSVLKKEGRSVVFTVGQNGIPEVQNLSCSPLTMKPDILLGNDDRCSPVGEQLTVKCSLLSKFPRRSGRVTASALQAMRESHIKEMLLRGGDQQKSEEWLGTKFSPTKGRGVITKKKILKDDYVAEYRGELLNSASIIRKRNREYDSLEKGSYMYYFKINGKRQCIDATEESGCLGRLINHSFWYPNVEAKLVIINNTPRLAFIALRDIDAGEELLYDYRDSDKASVKNNRWLRNS